MITPPSLPPPPPRMLTMGVELEMAIYGGATTQLIADVLSAAGISAIPESHIGSGGGGGGGGGGRGGEGGEGDNVKQEEEGDTEKPRPWRVTTDQSIISQAILDEDAKPTPHPGTRGTYAIDTGVPGKTRPSIAPNHATAPTGQNSYLQAELISPPFEDDLGKKTEQWHQEIHDALGALEGSAYTTDPNQSTGFHVHIGVGTQPEQVFTLEEVQKISALFLAYESRIDRLHPDHRVRNGWATSNVMNRNFMNAERPSDVVFFQKSLSGLVSSMCPPRPFLDDPKAELPTKCYKLNLWSLLDETHTIEWRQHEGTTDPKMVCRWADFTLAFVRKALSISKEELLRLEADQSASIFDDPLLKKAYFGTAD